MKNNLSIWHIMSFRAPLMTCLFTYYFLNTPEVTSV